MNDLMGYRKYTIRREMQDGRNLSWKSVGLNEKAKVVCDTCNSGWMSVVEDKTKSILGEIISEGKPKAFTTFDVNVISQFAFLKAVVCDHMTARDEPYYTVEERHSFRKSLSIPNQVRMWFGATLPNHGVFKSADIVMPPSAPNRFQLNVFTYSLGYFVLQVLGGRWCKKSARRHTLPPSLSQAPVWIPVSTRLWPLRIPDDADQRFGLMPIT